MKKSQIHLYTDISGNKINTTLYKFGSTNKKGIYIQGGIHGGEVTYFIFAKLYQWLTKNEANLKQNITLAPMINPVAWNQRIYYYTAGKFDLYKGKDWNRSYGSEKQNTLSERMSKSILDMARAHDFVIDLHTARTSAPYLIYTDNSLRTYILKYGLAYNFFIDLNKESNKKFEGTLNHALKELGIQCVTYECGSHDSHNEEDINEVSRSILSYLQDSSTATSTSKPDQKRSIFTQVNTIFAEISGFINYLISPRMHVEKGTPLMEIYSSGDLKTTYVIKSPIDGIILELSKTHICWEGDELIRIVPTEAIQNYD